MDDTVFHDLRARTDALERWKKAQVTDSGPVLGAVFGDFLSLLGLRGFWPMGQIDNAGNVFDASGNARTLTYHGNPIYDVSGLVPYLGLDGADDYVGRASEAGLNISGTESYIASARRGLTFGGWFWWNALNTGTPNQQQQFIGKWDDTGNNRSYAIYNDPVGGVAKISFSVCKDGGAAVNTVVTTISPSASAWHFLIGRWSPSTELGLYADGTWTKTTTSIVDSCFASAASFDIGRYQRVPNYLNGRASLCFLCAGLLSDTLVDSIFSHSRPFFGA